MSNNPYAPIDAPATSTEGLADAELIRQQYLSHEASVRSIGLLYYIGGVIGGMLAFGYLVGGVAMLASDEPAVGVIFVVLALVLGGICTFQLILARAIRRLLPWARIGGIVLSCIGLIGFPVGTLISIYFLYLLASQKGEYVFSEHYRWVIDATPAMKYKTSPAVWILLGILVLVFGLAFLSLMFSAVR